MMSVELRTLKPLLKYFQVLIDEYPNPISQTELAEKSSVTKSAVSKIRDDLKRFCNMRVLAFQRKLLLKLDNETFWMILGLFFLELKFQKFFRSNYMKHSLEKIKIHKKLVEVKDLDYGKYFSEEDTNLIIELVLRNICSYQIDKDLWNKFKTSLRTNEADFQVFSIMQVLSDVFSNFDLGVFENENELLRIIQLRDKFYVFIKSIAGKIINEWVVVKRIEDPQKKASYFEAYLAAIDYFLTSILSEATENIRKAAEEKKIPFDKRYSEIGESFQKGDEK